MNHSGRDSRYGNHSVTGGGTNGEGRIRNIYNLQEVHKMPYRGAGIEI